MKVRAKINAGVPARTWIQPLADKNDKKVWPRFSNGTLVHGGFLILKDEFYEIPDDKFENVKDIFEQVKEAKKAKIDEK